MTANSSTTTTSGIPIHVLATIIPIVILVAEVAYSDLGWKIYNKFGWKVYKFAKSRRCMHIIKFMNGTLLMNIQHFIHLLNETR